MLLCCTPHKLEVCVPCAVDYAARNDLARGAKPPFLLTRDEALARLTAAGQPLETRDDTCFVNGPQTLREMIQQSVTNTPFLVHEEETTTFREAYERACDVANFLLAHGVRKGDRVALSCRNYPEWIVAFMACQLSGAIAVAFNALWVAPELERALLDSGATVLFADDERLARLGKVRPPLVVAVRSSRRDGCVPFESIPKLEVTVSEAAPIAADDPCCIFYTSGSTGFPKGAVATNRMVLTALLSWELEASAAYLETGLPPPVVVQPLSTLLAVPLFHVTGSHVVLLTAFRAQRRIVLYSKKWNPAAALRLICEHGISSFTGPAAMSGDLVREIERSGDVPKSLLSVGGGGAPRDAEQVRRIRALKTVMPSTGWGMTETQAIGSGFGGLPQLYLKHPDAAGRMSPMMQFRLDSTTGELRVRGPTVIRYYWPNVPATDKDGWFGTGDLATIGTDGLLRIVGRVKEMIIRGGENISCATVEAGLLRHPNVIECSVYGLPDERLGEVVAATVYVHQPTTKHDVLLCAGQHLARFEVPTAVRIVSEPLPRLASEKIDKKSIRAAHLSLQTNKKSRL